MFAHQVALLSLAAGQLAVPVFTVPDPQSRVSVTDHGQTYAIADATRQARPVDAGLRQRIVDVAAAEWRRFRFPVTNHRNDERKKAVVEPRGGDLIPTAMNRYVTGIARQSLRLGYMEDDREVKRAIGGYWSTVPGTAALLLNQSSIFHTYGDAGWAVPWSAAFISYVMCSAGLADMAQFRRADGHAAYVDQAIETTDGRANGVYRARDIDSGLPAVGDLVCADRPSEGDAIQTVDQKRRAPGARTMHCDIVVKVQAGGREPYIALIGGNVVQAVTMTLVNIRPAAAGRPQRIETAWDTRGARPWIAILSLQAPGTASLENAPAIRNLAGEPADAF